MKEAFDSVFQHSKWRDFQPAYQHWRHMYAFHYGSTFFVPVNLPHPNCIQTTGVVLQVQLLRGDD